MRRISRSALVPYVAERMYALVDDIEAYPEFLPWCSAAVVNRREAGEVEATLEFRRGGLGKSFRTRNALQPPESITLELVDGPFRSLSGEWAFKPLGSTDDAPAAGCRVSLDLRFEFSNRVTDLLLGPFFEEICNSLVDAFTRRAQALYGGGDAAR
ncbi:MAG TPA: type II toxin-antitoxin system RatA family toxin [Woeseiaceae bacterium]|nr:type II toxin-antitoxin system RatA family toxin [Woeseiaceae bacterium]